MRVATDRDEARFPWTFAVLAITAAVPALVIAAICALALVGYSGPQYDVVIMNGHVFGGTEDKIFLIVFGSTFGAAGVFCALRFYARVAEWRRKTN